jgi:hypothetical protein
MADVLFASSEGDRCTNKLTWFSIRPVQLVPPTCPDWNRWGLAAGAWRRCEGHGGSRRTCARDATSRLPMPVGSAGVVQGVGPDLRIPQTRRPPHQSSSFYQRTKKMGRSHQHDGCTSAQPRAGRPVRNIVMAPGRPFRLEPRRHGSALTQKSPDSAAVPARTTRPR